MTKQRRNESTVTRSFRINEHALRALEEEAEHRKISVSSLLNKQLIAFAEFDRYLTRLGLLKGSLLSFQRLLQLVSEEDAALIGRETGSDTPGSIILAKYGSMKLENVIDFLQQLSEFGGVFEYSEADHDGIRVITLLHMLGPRGSVFLTNYSGAIFGAVGLQPKMTSTEHSVTIQVPMQKELVPPV